MKFRQEFIDLIQHAVEETEKFYQKNSSETRPNPFYVGFGNPNSDILLVGKEKAISSENTEALKYESIENPVEWEHHIRNSISYNQEKFWDEAKHYLNTFYPYEKTNKGGDTWAKYESLVNRILEKKRIKHNDFFKDSFLTEVNYKPSKQSQIKNFNDEVRKEFLKSPFYSSFKITVLACADYLSQKEIEEIFHVTFDRDISENHKLIVYKNDDRILVNTRQLSTSVPNDFLQKIADEIRGYL